MCDMSLRQPRRASDNSYQPHWVTRAGRWELDERWRLTGSTGLRSSSSGASRKPNGLLDRIGANPADPIDEGFRSIREMLNADLADKQGRLVRSRRNVAG